MSLEVEQMVEAAQVFQDAYDHVVGNMNDTTTGNRALEFTAEVILSEKPYQLVTEEGILHAREIVFGSQIVGDFVMTLAFTFFARWGTTRERYMGLVKSIAFGVGLKNTEALTGMPDQIANRLVTYEDACEVLQANQWLVILLMMPLFLRIKPGAQQ